MIALGVIRALHAMPLLVLAAGKRSGNRMLIDAASAASSQVDAEAMLV
jgi:hypothetical protein